MVNLPLASTDRIASPPNRRPSARETRDIATFEQADLSIHRKTNDIRSQPIGGRAKRLIDLLISAAALTALFPLMVILFVLVRTTMGAPVFFAHRRIGHDRKVFYCYKFRTMVNDAENVLQEHLHQNPDAAQEWMETQKLKYDPRVTTVGQLLRKSSLDELPQLFNILRGDMSCVGPRPIVEEELRHYGVAAETYIRARPGLTGMWQINGRSLVDYSQRVSLDCQYVQHWSIWKDITILMRTMFVVLKFEEAR
jgi:exopolysaccharide production protein ExoY